MTADVDSSKRASAGKPVIGIAGGIASGKSLVADLLVELGAAVIDSDAMVHEELADAEVIETFCSWWGERVRGSGGGIDRGAMSDVIFNDGEQRRRMEAFLYPRLEARRRRLIGSMREDDSVRAIVINSPLLYEVGLDGECDAVIFVECDEGTRLRRAAGARGWSEAEFRRRERLQKPLDEKRAAADYIVVNNSSVERLRSQVKPIFKRVMSQFAAPPGATD